MELSGLKIITGFYSEKNYHVGNYNIVSAYGLGKVLRGELISLQGETRIKVYVNIFLFTLILKLSCKCIYNFKTVQWFKMIFTKFILPGNPLAILYVCHHLNIKILLLSNKLIPGFSASFFRRSF